MHVSWTCAGCLGRFAVGFLRCPHCQALAPNHAPAPAAAREPSRSPRRRAPARAKAG